MEIEIMHANKTCYINEKIKQDKYLNIMQQTKEIFFGSNPNNKKKII